MFAISPTGGRSGRGGQVLALRYRQRNNQVAAAMAEGKAVTVAPHHTTLTTQHAADLLGISRPTLVKLLEAGELPYTQPGRRRRLRLSDVLAYRDRIGHERDTALDELAAVSDEAGVYDDEATRTRLRR